MEYSFFTDTGCVGNSYINISRNRLFTLIADCHSTPYMHVLIGTVSYVRETKADRVNVWRIVNNKSTLLAYFDRVNEEAIFYKQDVADLGMSTLLLGLFIRELSVDQA